MSPETQVLPNKVSYSPAEEGIKCLKSGSLEMDFGIEVLTEVIREELLLGDSWKNGSKVAKLGKLRLRCGLKSAGVSLIS